MTRRRRRASYLDEGYTHRAPGSPPPITSASRSSISISITFFFFIGGAAATLIRLELSTPAGDLLTDDGYNRPFTLHGVIMVWFFLIPSIPATLRQFPDPADDRRARPRLPAAQSRELVHLRARRRCSRSTSLLAGGVDTGWTFYTPFSHASSRTATSSAAIVGVFVVGFSSILTGLNFIVTVHKLRAPGMTWFRLPLFVWAHLRDRAHPRARDAGARDHAGADRARADLRHRHLRSGARRRPAAVPAPVLVLLPPGRLHHGPAGMGVVSELVTAASPASGSSATASSPIASLAIAVIGFLVWGHHMFVSGQSMYAGVVFSFLSFAGGGAVGDQGLQLDRHALQRLRSARRAVALRARLHRRCSRSAA